MRRAIPFAAVTAVVLAAWISFSSAQDTQRGGANAARAWEYRLVVLAEVVDAQQAPGKATAAVESKFNELGQDGWEYCGDLPGAAVFKRSKR